MFLFWLRPESQYSEKSSAKTKKIQMIIKFTLKMKY